MSLPDKDSPVASLVKDEMIDTMSKTVTQVLSQFPPVARLRLLAFMHLIENPDTLKASLELDPAGALRLTLDASVAPSRSHQH